MGERVDLAEQNLERARRFSDQSAISEMVSVAIPKSNFGDGSQQVANALTKVLLAHLDESMAEAIAHLEDEADEARAEMSRAFALRDAPQGDPPPAPPAARSGRQKASA
jgi:hypothetical protein